MQGSDANETGELANEPERQFDPMMNRAERRRAEREANKPPSPSRMAALKANADRLKQQAQGQPVDAQGIPQGPLGQFPPFVPSQINLNRLDVHGSEGDTILWLMETQTPYGGLRAYLTNDQMKQFIDIASEQWAGAQAGVIIAKNQADINAAATGQSGGEQTASGLIIAR